MFQWESCQPALRATDANPAKVYIKFSIVITCFNQRRYIRAAVESALSQNGVSKEVIVVDDGSSDGSGKILAEYRDRVQLLTLPSNRGAIAARNHGATHANGDYLVFLDGDDLLKPWALRVYDVLISNRKPTVILAQTCWFTGSVPSTTAGDVPNKVEFVEYDALIRKDRPAGLSASAYVVNRMEFWRAGGWTPGFFHLDLQDLSARLGLTPTILICTPATADYRVHDANSILSVPPFLRNAHRLLEKERTGEYPGGRACRFDRRTWFGGLCLFWVRRAWRAGLYVDAVRLLASSWLMILQAVVKRAAICVAGRKPIEEISLRLAD